MSSIDLRRYQPGDAAQVAALFDEFQDYLVALDPLKRLRCLPGYGAHALHHTLADVAQNDGVFFVAVDNATVVGFAAGTITHPSASELLGLIPTVRGRITELFVRTDYRGQGIGTRLLQTTEADLIEHSCTVIRIEVFVPNLAAHQLYQKLGYHDMDIDMTKVVDS